MTTTSVFSYLPKLVKVNYSLLVNENLTQLLCTLENENSSKEICKGFLVEVGYKLEYTYMYTMRMFTMLTYK